PQLPLTGAKLGQAPLPLPAWPALVHAVDPVRASPERGQTYPRSEPTLGRRAGLGPRREPTRRASPSPVARLARPFRPLGLPSCHQFCHRSSTPDPLAHRPPPRRTRGPLGRAGSNRASAPGRGLVFGGPRPKARPPSRHGTPIPVVFGSVLLQQRRLLVPAGEPGRRGGEEGGGAREPRGP